MDLKKFLAALMCAALLLCAAGCAKEPSAAPKPNTPEAAGVLFVSIGEEFTVVYDTEGLALALDTLSETAADVLASYDTFAGSACDIVVSELVQHTIALHGNAYNRVVVIKQAPGGQVPSDTFLEDVRVDTIAVTDCEVVLITADTLTPEGYISPDAAKDILTRQLKLTDVTMTCSEAVEGVYTLTFELDGAEQEYKVKATTGTVLIERAPEDLFGPDYDPSLDGQQEFEGYVPGPEMDSEDYYGGPIDPQ